MLQLCARLKSIYLSFSKLQNVSKANRLIYWVFMFWLRTLFVYPLMGAAILFILIARDSVNKFEIRNRKNLWNLCQFQFFSRFIHAFSFATNVSFFGWWTAGVCMIFLQTLDWKKAAEAWNEDSTYYLSFSSIIVGKKAW